MMLLLIFSTRQVSIFIPDLSIYKESTYACPMFSPFPVREGHKTYMYHIS